MKIFLLMIVWSGQDANLDFLPVRALSSCYQNWSLLKPKLQSNNSICDLKPWLFILPTELSCKLIWNKKIKTLFPITPSPEINRQPGSQLIWHSSAHPGDPRVTDRIPCPCSALPSRNLYPLSCSESNGPVLVDGQEQIAEGKGGWKPL